MRDRPALDLRLLAPVSVGVFAVAALIVLIASGALSGGDSGDSAGGRSDERRSDRSERRASRERSRGPATYTVESGDTLGSIAEDTGVSEERLQELNPELDPQTLATGQRINLRE